VLVIPISTQMSFRVFVLILCLPIIFYRKILAKTVPLELKRLVTRAVNLCTHVPLKGVYNMNPLEVDKV